MKQRLTLFLALLLVVPSFGQQEQPSDLESLLAAAKESQAANDFIAAAADYKQAVKLRPDIPELRANLGLMQHEAGNYGEAIESFQAAIKLDPSLYVPILFLGMDYLQTQRAKEAIPLLLKAQKLKATDPLPPLTLGRAYSSLGEYNSAIHAFGSSIRLDPKQASAWFYVGIAQLRAVEEAARTMAVSDADSTYAQALYADSLINQSRYNQASTLYQSILAAPDQPPCMASEAGFLYVKQGDAQRAHSQFQSERARHPECSLAILGEARLSIDAGSSQEALQLVQQVWAKDQGFLSANVPLLFDGMTTKAIQGFSDYLEKQASSGGIDQKLYAVLVQNVGGGQKDLNSQSPSLPPRSVTPGGLPQAKQEYLAGHYERCASALRNPPVTGNAAGLSLLAACSFFTGDYAATSEAARALQSLPSHQAAALYWSVRANEKLAFASLEQFQRLEPDSARSHILQGDIYRQREQYDGARTEYLKALASSPDDTAALLGLASAYYGNANVEKTIETAQKALQQSPEDPEINLLMGEALSSQHRFTDAEPFLLKSLGSKPQMLPHIHALLGEAYSEDGKTEDAIRELTLGAGSDEDGSVHYLLARLYRKAGKTAESDAALQQMKVLQQRRREAAVVAVRDAHPADPEKTP